LGDKNNNFSINQFINYGIDGRHPIGLSSFDRKKALTIFIPKKLVVPLAPDNEWYAVKTFGTEEDADSVETLKLFYTDMNNAIEAPDVSSLTIPDTGLTLRLQYSDTAEEYVIFDFVVGSAQVTLGSRPLGLRKHGIIVNPTSANEDLLPGTAEKIHVTLEGTATIGKAIQIIAHNNVGAELDTCNIEYRAGGNGEAAGFYFDEVNLSELKNTVDNSNTGLVKKVGDLETTVGDSDSGLVKDVNDNKTDITNLKGLSKISFYTGTNTSEVKAVKTDYTLESIVINTDDDLSAANFIGTVEFNGHRVNGHINYAPSGNKNGNGARNGIYYDSTSKRIIVDIILCNETAISWTFGAGEIRVKVLAIY
jgi:hypothetical protein